MLINSLSLMVRIAVVVAMGTVAVTVLNDASPMVVLGGPGEATVVVSGQLQGLTQLSVKLMSLGREVLAFATGL